MPSKHVCYYVRFYFKIWGEFMKGKITFTIFVESPRDEKNYSRTEHCRVKNRNNIYFRMFTSFAFKTVPVQLWVRLYALSQMPGGRITSRHVWRTDAVTPAQNTAVQDASRCNIYFHMKISMKISEKPTEGHFSHSSRRKSTIIRNENFREGLSLGKDFENI